MNTGSYTVPQFYPHLKALAPKVIVECGARDCKDSVDMVVNYDPDVLYAFECNPDMLPKCRTIVAAHPRIHLIEQAVWTTNGELTFFPVNVNAGKSTETGISSVFEYTYDDKVVQNKVVVPCTRLDSAMTTLGIREIDLLCMDVQGSELAILQSLGSRIKDVKAVITEVMYTRYYKNAPAAAEIESWMKAHGFKECARDHMVDFANIYYMRG